MYKGLWIAVPFDKRPNVAFGSCTNAKNYLAKEEGGEIWRGEDVSEMYDHSIVHVGEAKPYTTVVPNYRLAAEIAARNRDAAICKGALIAALTMIGGIEDMPTVEQHNNIRLHLADVTNSLNEAIELIRRTYDV